MRLNNESLQEVDIERVSGFAQWLLDVGNRDIGTPDESDPENSSWINIPEEYCIPVDKNGISNLIRFIYDDDTLHYLFAAKLQDKAIVYPRNDTVDVINAKIFSLLSETTYTYISYDDTVPHGHDRGEVELLYPKEYLNTLSFAGLPPHRTMATTSKADSTLEDKGKMIMAKPKITSIAYLRPAHYNKTIKTVVYHKWTETPLSRLQN
ncbi:DNA helicase [Tanacetum coccineum]